jgi:hypothetical protein
MRDEETLLCAPILSPRLTSFLSHSSLPCLDVDVVGDLRIARARQGQGRLEPAGHPVQEVRDVSRRGRPPGLLGAGGG